MNRVSLVVLAAACLVTGPWAYFAPSGWYRTFPGAGMSWLPQLGPYNEHFARDIGGMYLALGTLTVIALIRVHNAALVRATGCAWAVFNALHFLFHMTMLGMYALRDQVLNVVTLGLLLIVSVILLVPFGNDDLSP